MSAYYFILFLYHVILCTKEDWRMCSSKIVVGKKIFVSVFKHKYHPNEIGCLKGQSSEQQGPLPIWQLAPHFISNLAINYIMNTELKRKWAWRRQLFLGFPACNVLVALWLNYFILTGFSKRTKSTNITFHCYQLKLLWNLPCWFNHLVSVWSMKTLHEASLPFEGMKCSKTFQELFQTYHGDSDLHS